MIYDEMGYEHNEESSMEELISSKDKQKESNAHNTTLIQRDARSYEVKSYKDTLLGRENENQDEWRNENELEDGGEEEGIIGVKVKESKLGGYDRKAFVLSNYEEKCIQCVIPQICLDILNFHASNFMLFCLE